MTTIQKAARAIADRQNTSNGQRDKIAEDIERTFGPMTCVLEDCGKVLSPWIEAGGTGDASDWFYCLFCTARTRSPRPEAHHKTCLIVRINVALAQLTRDTQPQVEGLWKREPTGGDEA
jgi:hypothetical protein